MTTREKVDKIKTFVDIRRATKIVKVKGEMTKKVKALLKTIPREEYELYKEKLTKIMYGNKK